MLTTKAQYRLGDAKEYFSEHLSVGDYYSEGQQVSGQWYGEGAEKLGCWASHGKTTSFVSVRTFIHRPGEIDGVPENYAIGYWPEW